MLHSVKELKGYAIGATDGPVGHVKDLYFDDEWWIIRYLVVDTGAWLSSREVLVSPISIGDANWATKTLSASISKEQVRNSPDIDTDKPVSRQNEVEYLGYYGYPNYWGGGGLWGAGMYPNMLLPGYSGYGSSGIMRSEAENAYRRAEAARHENDDPHLRSCKAVVGYHVHATDGDIGHVEGMLVDDETWAVRYVIVDTSNWWLGHKVLIAPQWISEVGWADSKVYAQLTRQAVKDAPPYDDSGEFDRAKEVGIYRHYGRPVYWPAEVELETETSRR
jgi:hypothetical protein